MDLRGLGLKEGLLDGLHLLHHLVLALEHSLHEALRLLHEL